MRVLVHLSDLHFGRIDDALLAPLTAFIDQLGPDVVVVSGDLTQRARSAQFIQARRFLDALPTPQIIVPGNHDIPLHNVFSRFVRPLKKYQRHITQDLNPFFQDDEIAVLGVNTARSLTFKNGRINEDQLARVRERLCALDDGITRVVVTHHPFDLPDAMGKQELVGRAPLAMQVFAGCRIDLLLAGHFHTSHAASTASRYQLGDYSAIAIQAGTATSTRGRGETNSFNVIRISSGRIAVDRMGWSAVSATFLCAATEAFDATGQGWVKASAAST